MDSDAYRDRRIPTLGPHRLAGFDYRDVDHAYFLTICARHGTPFGDPALNREIIASLHWLRERRRLMVYAYCLMPDHLHLLVRLVDQRQPLGRVIGAFKSWTTRQSWQLEYDGQLWQPRFYDHIVRKSEAGERIVGYILANPVRKGLVEEASGYPWSGTPDPL